METTGGATGIGRTLSSSALRVHRRPPDEDAQAVVATCDSARVTSSSDAGPASKSRRVGWSVPTIHIA
jgi:hypothetical protein